MIRTLVSVQQLPGMLQAYCKAVDSVMYIVCARVGVEGYQEKGVVGCGLVRVGLLAA